MLGERVASNAIGLIGWATVADYIGGNRADAVAVAIGVDDVTVGKHRGTRAKGTSAARAELCGNIAIPVDGFSPRSVESSAVTRGLPNSGVTQTRFIACEVRVSGG